MQLIMRKRTKNLMPYMHYCTTNFYSCLSNRWLSFNLAFDVVKFPLSFPRNRSPSTCLMVIGLVPLRKDAILIPTKRHLKRNECRSSQIYSPVQPSLLVVYFGGNDFCQLHPYGVSLHVPLSEYKDNIRQIGFTSGAFLKQHTLFSFATLQSMRKCFVESTRHGILAAEILKATSEAKWEPSLYLGVFLTEFEDVLYPIQSFMQ